MKALLISLILWINQNSTLDYDPTAGLPRVVKTSPETLVSTLFNDNIPKHLSAKDLNKVKADVVAIYHSDRKIVYLRDNVDTGSEFGKAALVHELVHFVQYQTGENERVRCTAELERDAYDIQRIYMKQHGLEPEFDEFTVIMRSMCSFD